MTRSIRVSSSIANFSDALQELYADYRTWSPLHLFDKAIFFGAYHVVDYVCILIHRGEKKVFFCGSDILNLERSIWRYVLPLLEVEYICENGREWDRLLRIGIVAHIHPMFFGKPWRYAPSFDGTSNPHVFMTVHAGREKEYGLFDLFRVAERLPDFTFHVYGNGWIVPPWFKGKNVVWHGKVPVEQFDTEIRRYHSTIRFNDFDGFSENLAKSILLGQYPVSRVCYPGIPCAKTLDEFVEHLKAIPYKVGPNPQTNYWTKVLTKKVDI